MHGAPTYSQLVFWQRQIVGASTRCIDDGRLVCVSGNWSTAVHVHKVYPGRWFAVTMFVIFHNGSQPAARMLTKLCLDVWTQEVATTVGITSGAFFLTSSILFTWVLALPATHLDRDVFMVCALLLCPHMKSKTRRSFYPAGLTINTTAWPMPNEFFSIHFFPPSTPSTTAYPPPWALGLLPMAS